MRSYRHRYSLVEFLQVYALALRAVTVLVLNRVRRTLPPASIERLNLAVTEVNGCEVCSYAHTRYALSQGMDNEEIRSLLGGDTSTVPAEEAGAIVFAQHYADRNGRPDREAYTALREKYGDARTAVIVAAIQVMMLGNVMGLPLSALTSRLRGRPYRNSPLCYEAWAVPASVFLLPVAAVYAVVLGPRLPERILFATPPGPGAGTGAGTSIGIRAGTFGNGAGNNRSRTDLGNRGDAH
jgi:AhpD family alkylhydroperoxidase